MDNNEFRKHAHELVDWIADYMENTRQYPVRSQVEPGQISAQIADEAPHLGEPFENIFSDFKDIIIPGITHWQHPRFFAYFPGNCAPESQLAEMLMSALNVNGMIWESSPAATELEEKVVTWLAKMVGIPENWDGVIQDTASNATLCALLVAREKATQWQANAEGLYSHSPLKFYMTRESHSSIEKDVKIAGLGNQHIHFIAVNKQHGMDISALQQAINEDRQNGFIPAGIVACVGTTGMGASDDIEAIGKIAQREDIYLHIDAAYAGNAMVLPECQHHMQGIELADSYVFNPHKWMGIQFDCSAHFVKDKESLIRTLTILPEYLRSNEGVTDYRDWGIQLGRRMRALRVWFVLRGQGIESIQQRLRRDIQWAQQLAEIVSETDGFEVYTSPRFALFTFRASDNNDFNDALVKAVNNDGYTYLTRTVIDDQSVIRWSIGHMQCTWEDISSSWERVKSIADKLRQQP